MAGRPRSPDGEPPKTAWDVVAEKPWDLDAWVALIQPLETAGDAARDELRRAYEGILRHFPLCYGYWDKLARLERAAAGGNWAAAAPVYERGLAAVKCWELYLKYAKAAVLQCGAPERLGDNAPQDAKEQSAEEKAARDIFARAAADVGAVWDRCWRVYTRLCVCVCVCVCVF